MYIKRASTTAYIRVQMQQNETIHFFLFVQGERCSKFYYLQQTNEEQRRYIRKPLAARRETETMLNACLNQKISWSNEEKKEYKQMLDSSKENVVHWRFI